MGRRGDGSRRDVERFRGLGLRQTEDVAADDDLALPLGELGELDEKIDLVLAARDVPDSAKRRQGSEEPMAPAVPFPRPACHHEEPPFRFRDGATLAEGVLESVLNRIGGVLRARAHGDERPVDLRICGFACRQPIAVGTIDGKLPRQPYLHVLKCRGSAEPFSDGRRRPGPWSCGIHSPVMSPEMESALAPIAPTKTPSRVWRIVALVVAVQLAVIATGMLFSMLSLANGGGSCGGG